ncbi:MAG TPA: hypothetical protein EYQ31_06800 [Candidatus Handelsmanbacteria bacterium]|nr:hypothetical protein [Candidatus Handelsmanbacteria bacterium]
MPLGNLLELIGRREHALAQYRRATQIYTLSGEFPIENARVLDDLAALLQIQQLATSDSLRQRAARIRRLADR